MEDRTHFPEIVILINHVVLLVIDLKDLTKSFYPKRKATDNSDVQSIVLFLFQGHFKFYLVFTINEFFKNDLFEPNCYIHTAMNRKFARYLCLNDQGCLRISHIVKMSTYGLLIKVGVNQI